MKLKIFSGYNVCVTTKNYVHTSTLIVSVNIKIERFIFFKKQRAVK